MLCARLAAILACLFVSLSANTAPSPQVDPVTDAEIGEIRRAFQAIGLRQADVVRGFTDGRINLVGEYENRDEVETAFAATRAIIGLQRVAPTTPANIKYRLKGFNTAFASTVGKMMQKAPGNSRPATQPAVPGTQPVATAPRPSSPSQSQRGPKTLGLIVGVGEFKFLPKENGLEYSEKDAKDFYNVMVSPNGGSVPRDAIQLMTQEKATSAAVKAAMRSIIDQTQAGDTVVLFVASHGLPNAMGKFDIVLNDTEFPKQKVGGKSDSFEFVVTNRKTALSDDDLQGFIAQLTLSDVRTVIVLDTCYSGKTFIAVPGFLPSRTRSLSRQTKEANYSASLSQEGIQDLAQKAKDLKAARIVIVSASENEESMESPKLGGGAFTQAYIAALNKAHDFADAFDQTKPSVIRAARTMGHSQTPRMLVVPEEANTKM